MRRRLIGLLACLLALAPMAPATPLAASAAPTPPSVLGSTTTEVQPLQNADFEAGPGVAWSQSSNGGRSLIDGSAPHSGSFSAHLCQRTDLCADQISQTITAPARVLTATLRFWFRMDTLDSTTSSPAPCADYLVVGLVDAGGSAGANSALNYCEDWGGTGYNQASIDETGFLAGRPNQSVSLVARGVTDASGVSDFHVDDFTLTITTATAADTSAPFTAVSTTQYSLSNSDGSTWMNLDSTYLNLVLTPSADSFAIVEGNADLWTANAGVNQDLGIFVSGGGTYPTVPGQPEAWKESGGFAGTFSPNAAFVQTVIQLKANTTYDFLLQWKSNHQTQGGTIFSGAGLGPIFSPTRLSVRLVSQSAAVATDVSQAQFRLDSSDGITWRDLGPAAGPMISGYQPPADGIVVVSGNADLWTANAGVNQDIGIVVAGGVYAAGQPPQAWKESGGFAGTFSPNAAFVQVTLPVQATVSYDFKLQWKANHAAWGASIFAGAGPINGAFSPTRLTVQFYPAWGISDHASTQQYRLDGSDGAAWADIDPNALALTLAPSSDCVAILTGNADLWTATAGFNQDLGIQVTTTGSTLSPTWISWKESGGFAGTFSPNAAFVQAVVPIKANVIYTVRLQWKANRSSDGSSIFAGAGPIAGAFSPTRLSALISCS